MTAARKPETTAVPGTEATVTLYPTTAGYVQGEHTARVKAEHDARRTALLARHEVLATEIDVRTAERHDINAALALCSEPASNVTAIRQAAAE